jgi:predicted transcriptional regulator
MTKSKIVKDVEKFLKDTEVSKAEICRLADLSYPAFYKIMNGQSIPRKETEDKIYRAMERIANPISEFGLWVKTMMQEKNMSASVLSQNSSISIPSIYNIINGITLNPAESTKSRIQQAFENKAPAAKIKSDQQNQTIKGLGELIDIDPYNLEDIEEVQGVYVLYDISQRPVYVGRSRNIRKRIKVHSGQFWFKKPIVQTGSYISIRDTELVNQIEVLLIKFLKKNAIINQQMVDRDLEE